MSIIVEGRGKSRMLSILYHHAPAVTDMHLTTIILDFTSSYDYLYDDSAAIALFIKVLE